MTEPTPSEIELPEATLDVAAPMRQDCAADLLDPAPEDDGAEVDVAEVPDATEPPGRRREFGSSSSDGAG